MAIPPKFSNTTSIIFSLTNLPQLPCRQSYHIKSISMGSNQILSPSRATIISSYIAKTIKYFLSFLFKYIGDTNSNIQNASIFYWRKHCSVLNSHEVELFVEDDVVVNEGESIIFIFYLGPLYSPKR